MDENAAGATITAVSTENATEITVDNDHFEVADGNLKLKADSSLDFEAIEGGMLDVTITASGDGESASATVSITVNDVNEAPSIDVADGETPDGMAASSTVDENVAGAILGAITLSDSDAGQMHTLSTSDARFVTKQDAEGGWWLALADGVSLDHEDAASVTVTVTVTDDGDPALSGSTDVTITVNDVNEAPEAVGMVANITTLSGQAIDADAIDLLALFNDPDESDSNAVRYELSGQPSWLTFSVEFGKDDDGNDTAHGIFTGTPPTSGADSDAAHMVTLTATDSGGAEGSVSFYVIVDDGNDDITDVDLIDDAGNVAVEGEVDENDASGVVFGEIRVHDQDHAMHPNGMHLIQILRGDTRSESPGASVDSRFEVKYDDAGIPWLALKEGMSLDQEMENGSVDITIRAVDMNGATNRTGSAFTGNVEHQTVTILINDQNDAPKANAIGNWWVTTEDGQRSSDIQKGEWLTFRLEGAGDGKPAFTDPDGDTLTYSLSGPSWLEINARTGQITNTEGGVPVRGNHQITVTATDPDGESASAMFYLAVALSGDGTDATANDDNDEPRFGNPNEFDYPENSGERRVATFTVTDNDNDLGHHPFALDTVAITAVVNADDSADTNNAADAAAVTANTGYASAFRLSDPVKSGNTWTYHVYVRDTNRSPMVDTTELLDHEDVDRIEITITANDGTAAAVTETIDVRIDDVNDKPVAPAIGGTANTNIASGTYGVSQSETNKEVLYIRLENLWTDQEDDPDDLIFGVSVSGSWIKVLHGPGDWGDIEEGRDGTSGTADDVTWNDTTGQDAVVIGAAGTPAANEQVLIIELDRTGMNNGQGDMGSFTLTARDRDGATTSMEYMVPVADLNLNPTDAVTLSGSAREDATLRASFNDDKDPDLAGAATPALVIYQWFTADDDAGTGETLVSQGTSNTFRLTQGHVGDYITVKVKHYEVVGGQLVGLDVATIDNEATTLRAVSNTPDKGTGSITVLADANVLSVTAENVGVTDGDYPAGGAVGDASLTYSWQVSDNGRGGWEDVDQGTDGDTSTLELDDGGGKYYRAVVTYDADGVDDPAVDNAEEEMESVYSDPIQVSDVRDATAAAPAITGNAFPGGTLSVTTPNTSVQWQMFRGGNWTDIPGATGSLDLTQAHAGATIRALVSYQSTDDENPGVTAVVAVPTTPAQIPGGTTAAATPVAVGNHEIEASVTGTGHGPRGAIGVLNDPSNNAGHNLSLTEMVPLASLFQDPDSARLTFTVNTVGNGLTQVTPSDGTYLYDGTNASGGVLVFEASTGKLTFNSDVYQAHDGDSADGGGNILTLNIGATDGTNASTTTAAVNLRINVAPTDINFNDAQDGTGTTGDAITVPELPGRATVTSPLGMFIARVDVQDENASGGVAGVRAHAFGTHEVTLSGDDRFMLTNTNNARTDGDSDGSTWEVRLKPGASLDFEAENADNDPTIKLTLTATDGGGLSTPTGAGTAIELTITVSDVASDDPDAATPNDVPGLTDNDSVDDNEVDEGDDSDHDGGTQPPPPGMSLGQIEDFVDNMHGFEQNLLEDFMLVIDDGIDIA